MARSSRPWRRSAPGQDQEAAGVSLIRDPDAMELLVKVRRAVAAGAAAQQEADLRGGLLNQNQWESTVCLVSSAIPSRDQKSLAKLVGPNGSLNVFTAAEYNATVEFYWAPFLVSSNSDDPQAHSVVDRVIAWLSIAKHTRHWRAAHFLIFNTYIWWLNNFEMKEESSGVAGQVHAGGSAGGVQGGAQDVGKLGGPRRRRREKATVEDRRRRRGDAGEGKQQQDGGAGLRVWVPDLEPRLRFRREDPGIHQGPQANV
uniref:Trichome birefringence-like C-terminal domain-containing protein n=1 Tax=Aegilops tauschii TaxID=37682 RepID=M8C4S1_AEGTA